MLMEKVDPARARLHRARAAWISWMNLCLAGGPNAPVSPFQNFRNPIHDARPVVSPWPAPAPALHRDRLIYDARKKRIGYNESESRSLAGTRILAQSRPNRLPA